MSENESYQFEDGRDQDDIDAEIVAREIPSAPSDDPEISVFAAADKIGVNTVNRAMIKSGQNDESVANCTIVLGTAVAKTNAFGNATLDISALPDGEYQLSVTAPEISKEEAGPDFNVKNDIDYVWRPFSAKVSKKNGSLETAEDSQKLSITGSKVRIGLRPVWMRSGASSPRGQTGIDTIIIHHTASKSVRSDLAALVYSGAVSAHYLVLPNGEIIKLVGEDRRAWHAGYAYWAGAENVNARSIGIEITHLDGEYPEDQVSAVIGLVEDLMTAYPTIPNKRIIAHSDTAVNRPENRPPKRHGRKSGDPSSAFPWERLESLGLGLIPTAGTMNDTDFGGYYKVEPSGKLRKGDNDTKQIFGGKKLENVSGAVAELQRDLTDVGYYLGTIDGDFGEITYWATRVFQQHIFSGSRRTAPDNSGDGRCDRDTAEMLKRVLGKVSPAIA